MIPANAPRPTIAALISVEITVAKNAIAAPPCTKLVPLLLS